MSPTIVITLIEFAGRVARMREAQKRYSDVQAPQNYHTARALETEVDFLLEYIGSHRVAEAVREFGALVVLMRRDQIRAKGSKSVLLVAEMITRESDVDSALARTVEAAKQINAMLKDQK